MTPEGVGPAWTQVRRGEWSAGRVPELQGAKHGLRVEIGLQHLDRYLP